MRKIFITMALILLAVATAQAQQRVVKVGHIGTMADGPIYIAMEKGYFKERGIELQLERFPTGGAMMAPLTVGQLHIAGGAISVGFFNAGARGFPIKIVANRNRNLPGFSQDTIVVRADLADQLKTPADFKGRKFAHPGAGSVTIYMMGKFLEEAGLTLKDVEIIYMPFPDMAAAFKNKAIDAAVAPEPFPTLFEARGLAKVIRRISQYIRPNVETSGLFVNKEWAEKNRSLLNDFMVAYLKGTREFYEASIGGKNRPEVIDILIKHTRIKDRALFDKMEWLFIDPNGEIAKDSVIDQQEWYHKNGLVPVKADIDAAIDTSFAKYAVEQLGYYKVK